MDIDWRRYINSLDAVFPEVGLDAPDEETIKKQKSKVIGNLTKISLDIYIFDSDDLEQAYMMQNEDMKIYKDITLLDAILIHKKARRKKG